METAGEDRLPMTLEEAAALQEELARRVSLRPLARAPRLIGAVDAAYAEGTTYAAAVLCRYDTLAPVSERLVVRETCFPYLPGYFWLREAPPLLEAIEALPQRPDVLLVDGQGVAHPRRFGIACHLGVLTGIPSIGCAKSLLIGSYREPGREKGNWSPLEQEGLRVGAVLRTRTAVRPLFVSPGHLVTLEDALDVVLRCCTDCRVPEPLRLADRVARKASGEGEMEKIMRNDDQQPRDTEQGPVERKACRFCAIIRREVPACLVFEDEAALAFLDSRPLFPGHLLLVPREHHETLGDLPESLITPLFSTARLLARAVEEALEAEGTFIAMNNKVSQSVPHLHVHIVPRRRHDGLKGFFWPRHNYLDDDEIARTGRLIRSAVGRLQKERAEKAK